MSTQYSLLIGLFQQFRPEIFVSRNALNSVLFLILITKKERQSWSKRILNQLAAKSNQRLPNSE